MLYPRTDTLAASLGKSHRLGSISPRRTGGGSRYRTIVRLKRASANVFAWLNLELARPRRSAKHEVNFTAVSTPHLRLPHLGLLVMSLNGMSRGGGSGTRIGR